MALDITALRNVSSEAVKEAARTAVTNRPDTYKETGFESLLHLLTSSSLSVFCMWLEM